MHMKKFLLSFYLLSLVAYLGYSQGINLALSDSSGNLQPNSYVSKNGLPSDLEIVKHLNVHNTATSGNALSVKVKKFYISRVPGAGCDFCWASCYSEEVYVSPDPVEISPGHFSDYFSAHYRPDGNKGMTTLRWTFFDERNPNDSVCVNTDFSAFPVGMDENQLSIVSLSAFPNPASQSTTFTYELSDDLSAVAATLIVRNVLGSTIQQIELQNTTGKITLNTSDLSSGIYFYSMIVNGKPVITKKMIVKH